MSDAWITRSTRIGFENAIVSVRLESIDAGRGRVGEWTVVEIPDGVAVVPRHLDGSVTLIRQYRHALKRAVWELPAGRKEPGETPEVTARRELEEEAGLASDRIVRLGAITPLNGICRHTVHICRAEIVGQVPPRRETFEDIETRKFSPAQIDAMIVSGEIDCGIALAGLLLARTIA